MFGTSSPSATAHIRRARSLSRVSGIAGALAMSGMLLVPSASYGGDARAGIGAFMPTYGRGSAIARGRATVAEAARAALANPRSEHAALPRLSTGFRGVTRSTAPTRVATLGPAPRIVNATPPTAASSFPGLSSADNSTAQEPPDPWVAVNASYVVQSVNSVVRISTRAGIAVQTLPTWALFALPSDQTPSDPRIVWDTFHSRWVGVLLSFNSTFTQNYLNLAVSETADPLGAWDTYAIDTGSEVPDYPALASSTDRIVLTADDFELFSGGTGYQGSEIDVIAWSQILAGVTVTPSLFTSTNAVAHPRPAQVLSTSAIVHVVYEQLSSGDVLYLKVNGTATAPTLTDAADLTSGLGLAPFTLPPAPHNADGTTIANAVDERPTDAVWRNGRLWFVATYSTGAPGDGARSSEVTTGTTTPVSGFDILIAAAGYDLYMPGVGITSDDTAFIVMTASGTGLRNPTTVASRWTAADGFYATLPFFDTSDDTYGGTRWGDFVGVASDPALPGSVWVGDEVAAADHTWRTTVMRFAMPSVSSPPTQSLFTPSVIPTVTGSTPRPTVPVRISWGGSLAGSSGALFQVSQNVDGAGFETFASTTTTTSFVRSLAFGHSYQFEVRVRDSGGNTSAWQVGPTFTPTLYQETSNLASAKVTYSGTWSSQSSTAYSSGTAKYASVANASATFTATGVRSIGFVTTRATTRGWFKIYVDGVYKGTFSPSSAPTTYRMLFYQFSWSTAGNHNLKVVVVGTAGHPRVDVDAFVVLK
jgi:hypothetical protein